MAVEAEAEEAEAEEAEAEEEAGWSKKMKKKTHGNVGKKIWSSHAISVSMTRGGFHKWGVPPNHPRLRGFP